MLKLLLPILFPSWRFFSSIGPSPRVDVAFVTEKNAKPQVWSPFRSLPEAVDFTAGVRRLFHNPSWNEQLYINTCAEHLFEEPSDFYAQEIGERLVAAAFNKEIIVDDVSRYLVFRIRAITVEAGQVRNDVVFISQPFLLQAVGDKQ